MILYDLLGATGIESTGHKAGADSATPSDRFHNIKYSIEPQMSNLAAECNSYDVNLEDFLSGLDEGFSQSGALAGNRAA